MMLHSCLKYSKTERLGALQYQSQAMELYDRAQRALEVDNFDLARQCLRQAVDLAPQAGSPSGRLQKETCVETTTTTTTTTVTTYSAAVACWPVKESASQSAFSIAPTSNRVSY